MKRIGYASTLLALLFALGGCGSSTTTVETPTIAPAAVYSLVGRVPTGPVAAGVPTLVAFTIRQPDGSPLVHFKEGPGPHTGVHLILVRDDLSSIIHLHPPLDPNGRLATRVTFPESGTWHMVVDVFPATGQTNFQLFGEIKVRGTDRARALPAAGAPVTIDGYRLTIHGDATLRAVEASIVTVNVSSPDGSPTAFTPWLGALAHAVFFRQGSLDYFHTHVCAPGASGCTSVLGAARVSGTSSTPGVLKIGVLVPAPGTWRLFLQLRLGGRIVTAPFTLNVKS